jgi:hypothetical protein
LSNSVSNSGGVGLFEIIRPPKKTYAAGVIAQVVFWGVFSHPPSRHKKTVMHSPPMRATGFTLTLATA